jgi:hypothetical protein
MQIQVCEILMVTSSYDVTFQEGYFSTVSLENLKFQNFKDFSHSAFHLSRTSRGMRFLKNDN